MANKNKPLQDTTSATVTPPSPPTTITTQRAYTLRLRGVEGDTAWRDALWATHEAINKGAKVFGDWLLTLRGGLSHELAEARVSEKKGGKKTQREPTDDERKGHRILLSLSWLSVESAPTDDDPRKRFMVACGRDARNTKESSLHNSELALRLALQTILRERGVSESEIGDPGVEPENQDTTWLGQCGPSFAARIRDDAAWVNRSAMFDTMTAGWDADIARNDAHTLISFILKDDYLVLPTPKKSTKKGDGEKEEADEQEERQSAIKASSKGAGQRTRHPFSHLLGEGKPFGKPTRQLKLHDKWYEDLKPRVESSGIPVPPLVRGKKKGKDDGPAHTELLREMFSKSASRIAQIVTKQRQQEADRLARKEADKDLKVMEADPAYAEALAALREYSDEYGRSSGSIESFVLRPRQITGWDRIVKRWNAIKETDAEVACAARIDAVKAAQDEDKDKKFGDANLFFRLAEERFMRVWFHKEKSDATILDKYVKGVKARSDSERLKVAAFRHPDAYRNPIFCQFGTSRPTIRFRRLKAFTNEAAGDDPRAVGMLLWQPRVNGARLVLMHAVSRRMDREIGSACDSVQIGADSLPMVPRRGRLGAAAGGMTDTNAPSRVAGVFDLKEIKGRNADEDDDDGETGKLKEPKWNGTLSTNRRDLEAINKCLEKGDVSRAHRLRAQLRWTLTVSMEMEGLGPWPRFVEGCPDAAPFTRTVTKDVPKDKDDLAKGLAKRKGDRYLDAIGWPWQEFNQPLLEKPDEKLKDDEAPSLIPDKKARRGDKACLILSRIPSLRLLSVDLGHRFAASCAVWETLSLAAFKKEIAGRANASDETGLGGLFCHVSVPTDKIVKNGRNKGKPVVETTIYRRIGPDILDGKDYPAPWARLDRQFLIKLQGEERPARMASEAENGSVEKLESDLHHTRSAENPLPWQVDELMFEAVRTLRLALRRHGDAARLAFGFASDHKPMPGSRKFWFHKPQDNDTEPLKDTEKKTTDRAVRHREHLQDLLALWRELAISPRWQDDDALKRWNETIRPLIDTSPFTEPPPLDAKDAVDKKKVRREEKIARWMELWQSLRQPLARRSDDDDEPDRAARKADREAVRTLLAPVAESLRRDTRSRESLSAWWKTRWDAEDARWPGRLKQLRLWLIPRGLRARRNETQEQTNARKARLGAAMNVGGLSLTRLATLTEFRRQVQVGFFTRLKPNGSKAELGEKFSQSILDVSDRLREQRVKQLASRIAASALGLGGHWKDLTVPVRDARGATKRNQDGSIMTRIKSVWQEEPNAKYPPCHAVVIENLRNYRPDELQTRRENKQLMSWSSGKVRKYLEEACQLHGLHLRKVQPNYTSRQCSRTGLPGMRCSDVPVWDFLTKSWWRKRVKDALERKIKSTREKPYDAEAQMLVALDSMWPDPLTKPDKRAVYERRARDSKPLLLISKGGDLFVPAPNPNRPDPAAERRGTQADLNAAANIGLRALLDPDFMGKWWYVPCIEDKAARTAIPRSDKVRGSVCFGDDPAKPEKFGSLWKAKPKKTENGKPERSKGKSTESEATETTNYWCDVGTGDLRPAAKGGFWMPTPAYWKWVRNRTVAALWKFNGLTGNTPEVAPDEEP